MHEWYPMLIKIFAYYSHVGADVTNNINGIAHSGFVTLLVESGHGVDTAANTVRNRRADPSCHAHHTQCTSSQCVRPCARCHHTERHDVCGAERVFLTWQLSKRYARHAKTLGEDGKVAIRNIRKGVMDKIKKMKKAIGEDAAKGAEQDVQAMVKKFEGEVEGLVSAREKEILEG